MDQLMLTYLKVALWLADRSPSLSHILALCVESCVSLASRLGLAVAPSLACLACGLGCLGWCAPARLVCHWCGVWVGHVVPVPLLSPVSACLCVCRRGGVCLVSGWGAPAPCVLSAPGLVAPLSPLPCGLVALPHTVSLVWVWWPGLRGSGVRGVPRLVGWGVLTPGMSKPPSA